MSSRSVFDEVAGPFYGVNQLLPGFVDLVPEVRDIDIHHVGGAVEIDAPDAVQDLGAAQHFVLIFQQEEQELVFRGRQVHRPVVLRHGVEVFIEGDVPAVQQFRAFLIGQPVAAGQRIDPRKQLIKMKRLRQVIIGAQVQHFHLVVGAVQRAQHQDRDVDFLKPDQLRQLDPVQAGKHEVHQDHLKIIGPDHLPCGFTAFGQAHLMPRFAQPLHQKPADSFVIFYQENIHVAKLSPKIGNFGLIGFLK